MLKNKPILILAVILILLSAWLVWVDNPRMKREEEKKEKADLLFNFPEEAVQGVELFSSKGHIVLLKSSDGKWMISNSVDGKEGSAALPAETGEVEAIIRQVHDLRYSRSLDEPGPDLKSYGLSEPPGKVVLKIKGKGEETLLLGDDAPGGQTFFIKKGAETKVYTVQSSLRGSFEKELFAFRNRHLLRDLNEASVNGLEVKSKEIGWQLTRNGESWVLMGNPEAKIEVRIVSGFLMQLEELEGEKILSETSKDTARFGLARPIATIQIKDKGNKAVSLLIGQYREENSKEPLFAALGEATGPIFQIKNDILSLIPKKESLIKKPEPPIPAPAPPATAH
ncbi:MAG TPA: DUF4340 domain-containing protein [Nitrospiria bacterium]|nr:DUF4340 domain-containing protein [Nitrospiria bacterium]